MGDQTDLPRIRPLEIEEYDLAAHPSLVSQRKDICQCALHDDDGVDGAKPRFKLCSLTHSVRLQSL